MLASVSAFSLVNGGNMCGSHKPSTCIMTFNAVKDSPNVLPSW